MSSYKLSAICVFSYSDPKIPQTVEHYLQSLSDLSCPCELVLVDNGAGDLLQGDLRSVLEHSDVPSTIVSLHRGSDESTAVQAGLKASSGQVVAILPEYLQTDPDEFGRMLDEIDSGADYVASWRFPRVDAGSAGLKSTLFNRMTKYLSGVDLHDINSGLRFLTREVTQHVPVYADMHRFWPILASKQGFRVVEVKTRHLEERVRKGDHRMGVYLRRLLDLLTLFFLIKFTRKPLRFFGLTGTVSIALGTTTLLVMAVQRVLGVPMADRPLLIFGVLMIVLGIQLFSLGLLGELIIYTHGRQLVDHHVEKVFESGRESMQLSRRE